jgi:hypothetical protein
VIEDFTQAHAAYVDAWIAAMRDGDTAPIEAFMAPDYHGWYAPSSRDEFAYDRASAVAGMRDSVANLRGATFVAAHRSVSVRGRDEAVICYEKRIERSSGVHSASLVLEAWRREGERWWLHREMTEYGAANADAGDDVVTLR